MTIKELKELIKDYPDNSPVWVWVETKSGFLNTGRLINDIYPPLNDEERISESQMIYLRAE